ncbi:hypothetical protein VOLCADRAFT_108316 [Volvox carteri f. nagariensis]|uniref:Uncharacterized protein n=1 Tax=Volvox carteri f. nagariensis TaxID=3068 RepID=D8UJF0_VOLCA|nr:uncharacterized protein VOLCADRAFT_108316 [Volvox carteri f. nagariensis]EFJ40160.1 hypothetical protein VOLCADRAFT_108316 [Volvox carteri f. nagariensis]|eukprot:XP_002958770.1 hypothetical protein VOLCADRAFT_108316 [Volvox carteri f. nagariensis]
MFRTRAAPVNGPDLNPAKRVVEAVLRETEKASREAASLRCVIQEQQQEIEARDDIIKADSELIAKLRSAAESLEQQLRAQNLRLSAIAGLQSAPQPQPPSSTSTVSRPPSRPSTPPRSNRPQASPQQQVPQQQQRLTPFSTHEAAVQSASTNTEKQQLLEASQMEVVLLRKRTSELESERASLLAELQSLRPLAQQVSELEPLRLKVVELESELQNQDADFEPLQKTLQEQQDELSRLRRQVAELAPLRAQLTAAQREAATAIHEHQSVKADFLIYTRKYESLMAQKLQVEEQRDALFNPSLDMAIVRQAMPAVDAAMSDLEARLQAAEAMLLSDRVEAEYAAQVHREQRCSWRAKMDALQARLAERDAQLAHQAELLGEGGQAAAGCP